MRFVGRVGGGEDVRPFGVPGAVLRQVKRSTAGAGDYPGREVDDFAADRAGSGLGYLAGGEDSGGAGQIVGPDRGDQSSRVCGEPGLGKWARTLSFRSALTCSIRACRRWTLFAATASSFSVSTVVKKEWKR